MRLAGFSRVKPVQGGDNGEIVEPVDTTFQQHSPTEVEVMYRCPRKEMLDAVAVIGGKWKALIICELSARSMRYSEIEYALSYISHRVLTYELRLLLEEGVILRSNGDDNVRVFKYSLTPHGRALHRIISDLICWSRIKQRVHIETINATNS